ncbi:uncharacterized protein LOC126412513 isoform X2 [Schistocerca serialis cubense]|uniref:uncharacterized protein LOC126412513 isoform X2 n=1 Tax=Schistocerca serialis cubense TaxID=2023355 RepID=UPI00214F36C4|nr:uncharacterized protein LOC126412513 isoform X2 [Schistocerca serialis cubense]
MRNVEIKAKVRNLAELISRAEQLSNSKGEVIKQEDTFYNVPRGRLKLRKFEDGTSQLICYERADTEGPKVCEYTRVDFPPGSNPGPVLAQALGIKGTVKKTRRLYLVGNTRIHIDEVFGLGKFMELEVVLTEDQRIEEGQAVAEDIRRKLGVEETDLLSGAYMDMLLRR